MAYGTTSYGVWTEVTTLNGPDLTLQSPLNPTGGPQCKQPF